VGYKVVKETIMELAEEVPSEPCGLCKVKSETLSQYCHSAAGKESQLQKSNLIKILKHHIKNMRVFQNSRKFTFPCHPEAVRPKDLFFNSLT
jgi:hypothetical protein